MPAVLFVFLVVPLAFESFEQLIHWDPAGTDPGNDGSFRIDFVGTSVLSSLAWPLALVALIGVPIGKRRAALRG